ncbi:MAG: hypothetical protein K0S38_428 [Candidatus Paceibacter sp.]|jgi:hypothetical protein|nr:hypothetical protein [Candidatus Paceibacter sp.]
MEQRFDKLEEIIKSLYTYVQGEFTSFRHEVKEEFAKVDTRFDHIDERLERIETKLGFN